MEKGVKVIWLLEAQPAQPRTEAFPHRLKRSAHTAAVALESAGYMALGAFLLGMLYTAEKLQSLPVFPFRAGLDVLIAGLTTGALMGTLAGKASGDVVQGGIGGFTGFFIGTADSALFTGMYYTQTLPLPLPVKTAVQVALGASAVLATVGMPKAVNLIGESSAPTVV